ncbi:MAG: hypothetical protein AAGU27_07180 [Dehalobacterium sp.]
MNAKPNCNIYEGGKIPPCSAFLNNSNPIIKDGKLIYRNNNRLFYFISTAPETPLNNSSTAPVTTNSITNAPFISTNIQISLYTFVIGLYINQVQLNMIEYDKNNPIHSEKDVNDFIHNQIQDLPKLNVNFVPTLSLVISNGNAILPPFTYTINITPLNYFILFILDRIEGNPGLLFFNNSFATEDPINFILASMNIQLPLNK